MKRSNKISCFVKSSILWNKIIFLVGCLNNRGLPIVRSSKCSSFKKSQHASESSDTQAPEKSATVFPLPHHLFTQKTIYVFSKHGRKKFACFLFTSHKQWIWLGGKNLWQFCLFSSRLLSWHTPPHEVRDAPPCFTSAQVYKFHKCTSGNVKTSVLWGQERL